MIMNNNKGDDNEDDDEAASMWVDRVQKSLSEYLCSHLTELLSNCLHSRHGWVGRAGEEGADIPAGAAHASCKANEGTSDSAVLFVQVKKAQTHLLEPHERAAKQMRAKVVTVLNCLCR